MLFVKYKHLCCFIILCCNNLTCICYIGGNKENNNTQRLQNVKKKKNMNVLLVYRFISSFFSSWWHQLMSLCFSFPPRGSLQTHSPHSQVKSCSRGWNEVGVYWCNLQLCRRSPFSCAWSLGAGRCSSAWKSIRLEKIVMMDTERKGISRSVSPLP